MPRGDRVALRLLVGLGIVLGSSAAVTALSSSSAGAGTESSANSHWTWCNDYGSTHAPRVLYLRIESATKAHTRIPDSFWTNLSYRRDLARIVCYESTYYFHASAAGQYGWYQLSRSLMSRERVSWQHYWEGTKHHPAGWFQCVAGEVYVRDKYGTPLAAWRHEQAFGWY